MTVRDGPESADTKRLLELIGRLQAKIRGKGVSRLRAVCCYEAGYDGFWLHRVLLNHGVENYVLDAASLPIDRRAKHIKGTSNNDDFSSDQSPAQRDGDFGS